MIAGMDVIMLLYFIQHVAQKNSIMYVDVAIQTNEKHAAAWAIRFYSTTLTINTVSLLPSINAKNSAMLKTHIKL